MAAFVVGRVGLFGEAGSFAVDAAQGARKDEGVATECLGGVQAAAESELCCLARQHDGTTVTRAAVGTGSPLPAVGGRECLSQVYGAVKPDGVSAIGD